MESDDGRFAASGLAQEGLRQEGHWQARKK
jgi:hypothetical protein